MTEIDLLKQARDIIFLEPRPEILKYRNQNGVQVSASYAGQKRVDVVSLLECCTDDRQLIHKALTRLHALIGPHTQLYSWTDIHVARALDRSAQENVA